MFGRRKRFADRVVVVTGAGSGIGLATATMFADLGARVHVVDIHAARAQRAVEALQRAGASATAHEVDVGDAEAVEAVAEAVYREHGRCDVLINNAGVGHSALVQETSLSDWEWVLRTNLWGVVHGVHAFVPRMIDQRADASVINVASIAGLVGVPSMAPYCASKFAVVGLSESLTAELRPYGIHVAAVCPGVTDTDIVRGARIEGSLGNRKRTLTDLARAQGVSPQRVARQIVATVRSGAPLASTFGRSFPMLVLRRLSPRAYRAAAGIALGRFLGARP